VYFKNCILTNQIFGAFARDAQGIKKIPFSFGENEPNTFKWGELFLLQSLGLRHFLQFMPGGPTTPTRSVSSRSFLV
jgi:hypothetical protein